MPRINQPLAVRGSSQESTPAPQPTSQAVNNSRDEARGTAGTGTADLLANWKADQPCFGCLLAWVGGSTQPCLGAVSTPRTPRSAAFGAKSPGRGLCRLWDRQPPVWIDVDNMYILPPPRPREANALTHSRFSRYRFLKRQGKIEAGL